MIISKEKLVKQIEGLQIDQYDKDIVLSGIRNLPDEERALFVGMLQEENNASFANLKKEYMAIMNRRIDTITMLLQKAKKMKMKVHEAKDLATEEKEIQDMEEYFTV